MSEKDPCRDCGQCCRRMIVEIDHVDIVREPKLAKVAKPYRPTFEPEPEDEPWCREYELTAMKPCPMLGEGNRCTIYPTRPNVCVGFTVGSEACNELREAIGLPMLEKQQGARP